MTLPPVKSAPPTARHLINGNMAEAMAHDYLLQHGLVLLDARFSCPIGEIDLVMRDTDNDEIVFVEVRSRGKDPLVDPLETVTRHKQRRIILTAECYLQKYPRLAKHVCRFDVIGILGDLLNPEITWIPAAFSVK